MRVPSIDGFSISDQLEDRTDRRGSSECDVNPIVRRRVGVVTRNDGGPRPPVARVSAISSRAMSVSRVASLSTVWVPRISPRMTGCPGRRPTRSARRAGPVYFGGGMSR
jgi:hypothetical protein